MVELLAVASPGLEPIVAREIEQMGKRPTVRPGHVRFQVATLAEAAHACRMLRTPGRLLLPVARGRASNLEQLASIARKADWSLFLRPRDEIDVAVTSTQSRIQRKDAAAKKVQLAIRDSFRGRALPPLQTRTRRTQHIRVRLDGDEVILSVDVGGDLLHRRGWRQEAGKAPIRENFAASMLVLAGWDGDEPLHDPFCGAGTLPIEAAMLALGRSPFVHREFAWEGWPALAKSPLARDGFGKGFVSISGSDHHAPTVERARANARLAGVSIEFWSADVADLQPPAPHGLLVTNPPYGGRLGSSEDSVGGVFRNLGHLLRGPFQGWRALFLATSPQQAYLVDRSVKQLTTFSNGGIRVGAYAYEPENA